MDDLLNELSAEARMQLVSAGARRRMHYRILNVSAVVLACCLFVIALIVRH